MIERFEKLAVGTSRIYKSIQRIKKHQMGRLGMKGTHVMCIYYLGRHAEGLTAAELCRMCGEDKAGISRILSDLEKQGLICYELSGEMKKYRANALLTVAGKGYAEKINEMILNATIEGGRGITDAEREIFYRVLSQISGNLENLYRSLNEA